MQLNKLKKYSPEEVELYLLKIVKAKKDPWFFVKNYCYTFDSHDKENSVKLIPDLPGLEFVTRTFEKEDKILVFKSRQVMISWLFACLTLWTALTHTGAQIFVQRITFEKACKLLKRIKFIYEHLPQELKQKDFSVKEGVMIFPETNAEIYAVKQGSEQVAGETVTLLVCDEMSIQAEAYDSFVTTKPAVDGGGKFVGIATARDESFFQYLYFDREQEYKKPIK